MRICLHAAALICAAIATGLVFGWGFWIFDEPVWQRDWAGWLSWSVALYVASTLPLTLPFDNRRNQ